MADSKEIGVAIETDREVIVVGTPTSYPDLDDDDPRQHNCDAMGCSSFSHVLFRFPKPPVTA